MEKIRNPIIKVTYNHNNISKLIEQHAISFRYVDVLDGASDEIEITLEDTDGKWKNENYPQKSTRIEVEFGYDDNLLKCGVFYIVNISFRGLPDQVTIRGLATSPNQNVRTIKTKTHTNKTLKQIVDTVAASHGFTVIGTIKPHQIYRATQNEQTDLAFLAKIAREFGYVFSIRDKQMIFQDLYELSTKRASRVYDKSDMIDYNMDDNMIQQYKNIRVVYHSARTKQTTKKEVNKNDKLPNGENVGGIEEATSDDTLVIVVRAENEEQAQAKANAILFKNNTNGQTGNFTFVGDYLMVAGSNVDIHGFGMLSGTWLIKESTHTFDRSSGYKTSIGAARMKDVANPEYRTPKKKKSKPKPQVTPPKRGGGGGGGFISYDSPSV